MAALCDLCPITLVASCAFATNPYLSGMTNVAELPERGAIEVGGDDRVAFLQGLVSNDVATAAPGRAVWAAFLTPQGKWLADFFIHADGDRLLLDAERAQIAMLVPRLSRYRLRAKATVAPAEDFRVYAAWGGPPPACAIAAPDPRLPEAGWRLLSKDPIPTNATAADYDAHRLSLGLPDGSHDMESEKSTLLEAGFDELQGVSWSKGCYMGQELTARTKYRGLIKRRLVPVAIDGPSPAPGSIVYKDGIDVGTMRSSREGQGLAVVRLDAIGARLTCGEAALTPLAPPWMRIP
jgi:folate-binding protein YgfZ